MEQFTHEKLTEVFENIRSVTNYYDEQCYVVSNDKGSEIAKIAYLNDGDWHIEIDNFPNNKKYYQYNFPIKDANQFKYDMRRIGLELTIKIRQCTMCNKWSHIEYSVCEECNNDTK